jgi:hypothetical protein
MDAKCSSILMDFRTDIEGTCPARSYVDKRVRARDIQVTANDSDGMRIALSLLFEGSKQPTAQLQDNQVANSLESATSAGFIVNEWNR